MENEIKVNDFVRYKDGDIIQIFQKIDREYVIKDNKDRIYTLPESAVYEDIVKHSSNLINLIQCGDLVKIEDNCGAMHWFEVYENSGIYQYEILEIVTKEMMESISYKVKQEEN